MTIPSFSRKAPLKLGFHKLWQALLSLEGYLGAACLIVMTFAIFINVAMRYLFMSPIRGAEEFARFTVVWVVFLGGAIGITRRNHLSSGITDFFLKTDKGRLLAGCVRDFIGVVFSFLFLFYSYRFLTDSINFGVHSQDLDIPIWLPQSAFFVGAILFLVAYLLLFVEGLLTLKRKNK